MNNLLMADIGGTHARFSILKDGKFINTEKYKATEFESLEKALFHYCMATGTSPEGELLIATAAQKEKDDIWRFTNKNTWEISKEELDQAGWTVRLLLNDFVASAKGAVCAKTGKEKCLKEGKNYPELPKAIIGPGTGLGLAYAYPEPDEKSWRIQETFGGHMLATMLSEEQKTIANLVARDRDTTLVPEDLCSGRGLILLYRAICTYHGASPNIYDPSDLLDKPDHDYVPTTLRLFHEFLGLFTHNALVTAHAFGGLYLNGGVLHALDRNNLFDFEIFEKYMILNPVPVVKDMLETTPVYLIEDPFIALEGLKSYYEEGLPDI